MFSSFAFHQGAALHVCKSRNILFSHTGKDRQHFHVAYLSDKCYYYRNAICSWLTSSCVPGDFSFVSHLWWLSRYFHLTSQVKVKVKVIQLCLTLCNPMDSIVHIILQARILEWVPSPGDLPSPGEGGLLNPGIEPRSPALQADSLPAEPHRHLR